MSLIFVDCESIGPCPSRGILTEIGACDFKTRKIFHRVLFSTNGKYDYDIGYVRNQIRPDEERLVFIDFKFWIDSLVQDDNGKATLISDNPAYDWQWINDGFHRHIGKNPFGFSARRIGDFYAGLTKDIYNHNTWKKLRVTKHDHNSAHDAQGNAEAFQRILNGERV